MGVFTHGGVELEDAGEFAQRCKLTGPDEAALRQTFHPELVAYLGSDGRWFIQAVNGQLLLYRTPDGPPGPRPRPRDRRAGDPRPAARRPPARPMTDRGTAFAQRGRIGPHSQGDASVTRRTCFAVSTFLAALVAVVVLTPPAPAVGPDAKDVQTVLDKGYAFLKKAPGRGRQLLAAHRRPRRDRPRRLRPASQRLQRRRSGGRQGPGLPGEEHQARTAASTARCWPTTRPAWP